MHSCGSNITILVGLKVPELPEIPDSYRHACQLLETRFIHGHKRIIANRSKPSAETKEFDINVYLDSLQDAIFLNNMNQINNLLEEIRRQFVKINCQEEVVKINYINLYVSISSKFIADNEPGRNNAVKGDVLSEIHKKTTLQDLHGYIKYLLVSISDEYARSRFVEPVYKILNYIEMNYYKDLKLEVLSSLFNYNSAYLGKLFKSSTGKYFNTYLDLVRIEKAKQFLKRGWKVYQVAPKWLHDIDYFR